MSTPDLLQVVTASLSPPRSRELDTLVDTLRKQHGEPVEAILLYGSCLRSGDLFDGLVDLYLVVNNYRAFYSKKRHALANWLLPPNVFYIEIPCEDRTLRAKYAIVSRADFTRGTSPRWFHSYLWGRFTQPVALVYNKDKTVKTMIAGNLTNAICTFLDRVLPRLPARGTVRDLWLQGLQLSYRAELRAETGDRATTLIDHQPGYYRDISRAATARLSFPVTVTDTDDQGHYQASVPAARRTISRITWPLRQLQGKLLSILRLLKALFTFEGGLDYIAWKLERHSGQKIDIPDRVRRYPLIFIWGLFWRLYRRGIFR